jgi:hypothetical protein
MNLLHSRRVLWIFLVSLLFCVIAGVYLYSQQYLVIPNQNRAFTIVVKKAHLPRGGFIVMNIRGVINYGLYGLVQSEYLPAGVYRDFEWTYVATSLDEHLNQSYKIRAVMYEDSNSNKQFDPQDRMMRNIFGQTIERQFVILQQETPSVMCQQGFSEIFKGNNMDRIRWAPSVQNVQNNGLFQKAQYNGELTATTLYAKQRFSGDIDIQMQVDDFVVEKENANGYKGRVEVIFESQYDRIFSIRWVKDEKGSYLMPEGNFTTTQVFEPHFLSSEAGLRLQLRRKGIVGQVWADEGNGLNKLWEFPVAADDGYMGILTADSGTNPQLVTSRISNIQIGCPVE